LLLISIRISIIFEKENKNKNKINPAKKVNAGKIHPPIPRGVAIRYIVPISVTRPTTYAKNWNMDASVLSVFCCFKMVIEVAVVIIITFISY
jgi:hypothetical protein